MLDASRVVQVLSAILDPERKQDYIDDIKEQYDEVRADHAASKRGQEACQALAKVRARPLVPAVKGTKTPTFLGPRAIVLGTERVCAQLWAGESVCCMYLPNG